MAHQFLVVRPESYPSPAMIKRRTLLTNLEQQHTFMKSYFQNLSGKIPEISPPIFFVSIQLTTFFRDPYITNLTKEYLMDSY